MGSTTDAPSIRNHNPYETAYDEDDTSDEWWDEEDTNDSTRSQHTHPTHGTNAEPDGLGLIMKPTYTKSIHKVEKRYSVQRLTRDKSKGRQKKQIAKAGIKVVTDFSRHKAQPPVQLQPSKTLPHLGTFIDLAALQSMDNSSREPKQTSRAFWKSRKDKDLTRAGDSMPSLTTEMPEGASRSILHRRNDSKNLVPFQTSHNDDLSPDDRPIVIGISIPSLEVRNQTLSPQTAASDTTRIVRSYEQRTPTNHIPDTPTIIITPAQETSAWNSLNGAISPSIYSPDFRNHTSSVPPVPDISASILEDERQRIAAQKSYFSPDSDDATHWGEDDTPHTARSRHMSSGTIFEEDESPVIVRAGRAMSIMTGSRADRHASISTVATNRRSLGWWNYITTPFLTRSNTFANRDVEDQPPPLPSLAIAAAKAQEAERERKQWDKQFSPLTPETTTSVTSDPWWNLDQKKKDGEQSPVVKDKRHKVQASDATIPFVMAEVAPFGTPELSSIATEDEPTLRRENTSATMQESADDAVHAGISNPRSLQSNNPFAQIRLSHLDGTSADLRPARNQPVESVRPAIVAVLPPQVYSPSTGPPPPYVQQPTRAASQALRVRAVFPPGHPLAAQYPASPGPISPGLAQAMSSQGAIPLSDVSADESRPSSRRAINLNSGYPEMPVRPDAARLPAFDPPPLAPSKEAAKAEARRRRHEKEEAVAHKAGGLWRGRGCIPNRGCYGRKGAEGRTRRRWYIVLVIIFLAMIILVVSLATTLHRKSNTVVQPSQWLNLTGFPPIFLGLSTVAAPLNPVANTGCIFPATMWSCALPKEEQASVAPNQPNQPNFFLEIQWDNSSQANSTFSNVTGNKNLVTRAGNPVSAGQFMRHLWLKVREIVTFVPSPAPPSFAEEVFLGNTTDGIVSSNKAGEPTPFYISFLPSSSSSISARSLQPLSERATDPFPNITALVPPPSTNSNGTASPANLVPFPTQQLIRLYDRGLPTEHYGFYTYFDRSIFLKSTNALNASNANSGEVPDDLNGGALETAAGFRCTWAQTRFLVQMWTRMNTTAKLVGNTTSAATSNPATDLVQPGSFPYPITITTDRHGGDAKQKMLYCYALDDREKPILGSQQLFGENRGFGGTIINPAAAVFNNASTNNELGGFDGGTGGCSCAWENFQTTVPA